MLDCLPVTRLVRMPHDFGDIVYHKARTEKVAGLGLGFIVVPGLTKTVVRWGNNMEVEENYEHELSSEY